MNKKQQGFSVVEIIAAVFIVGLIVVVGTLVWHKESNKKPTVQHSQASSIQPWQIAPADLSKASPSYFGSSLKELPNKDQALYTVYVYKPGYVFTFRWGHGLDGWSISGFNDSTDSSVGIDAPGQKNTNINFYVNNSPDSLYTPLKKISTLKNGLELWQVKEGGLIQYDVRQPGKSKLTLMNGNYMSVVLDYQVGYSPGKHPDPANSPNYSDALAILETIKTVKANI